MIFEKNKSVQIIFRYTVFENSSKILTLTNIVTGRRLFFETFVDAFSPLEISSQFFLYCKIAELGRIEKNFHFKGQKSIYPGFFL